MSGAVKLMQKSISNTAFNHEYIELTFENMKPKSIGFSSCRSFDRKMCGKNNLILKERKQHFFLLFSQKTTISNSNGDCEMR